MTEPIGKTPLEEWGADPQHVEMLMGNLALTFLEYLIATRRWMNGEGHKDEKIFPLMEKVISVMGQHVHERLIRLNKHFYALAAQTLTDVYSGYQEGAIPDQEGLRDVVKQYFDPWKVELTPGQLSMFAPGRETITEHGGPAQFAKYALGRLQQVHWKSVHNWGIKLDEFADLSEEQRFPYGIKVTPQEIRDFVGNYVDQLEGGLADIDKFFETTLIVETSLRKSIQAAQTQQDVSDAPRDQGDAQGPVGATRRKAPGPGRPRRRSK